MSCKCNLEENIMVLFKYFPEYLASVKSYQSSFYLYYCFASNAVISVREEVSCLQGNTLFILLWGICLQCMVK